MISFKEFLTEKISTSKIVTDFNRILSKIEKTSERDWHSNYSMAISKYLDSIFPTSRTSAVVVPPVLGGSQHKGVFEFTMAGAYVDTVNVSILLPNTFDIDDPKQETKLQTLITHELVHANQVARANSNLKAMPLKKSMDVTDSTSYFGNKMEIEAYAVQAAIEVLSNLHPSEIKGGNEGKFRKVSPAFNHYYKTFAKSDSEIWNRFLKKFYQAATDTI